MVNPFIFYSDPFVLPLPEGHRFPMAKYARLRERLVESGVASAEVMAPPPAATDAMLGLVHTEAYRNAVTGGRLPRVMMRRIGFPWSPEMVERSRRSVGGTLAAARAALRRGAGINLAGGTHHAFADRGEGYCVFNDVAVAVRVLQGEGQIGRALIVDCDVHQGNGTARIFADDRSVFTFDVFCEANFPFEKEPCDLAVSLRADTGDDEYLARLAEGLADAIGRTQPDLACYVSGADPFEGDALGRLALTRKGLAERDRVVMDGLRRAGIPAVVVMAGGYAANLEDTVSIHLQTVAEVLG